MSSHGQVSISECGSQIAYEFFSDTPDGVFDSLPQL